MRIFSAENRLMRIFRQTPGPYTTKVVTSPFTIIRVGLQRSGVVVQPYQGQNRTIEMEAWPENEQSCGKTSVSYTVVTFVLRSATNEIGNARLTRLHDAVGFAALGTRWF